MKRQILSLAAALLVVPTVASAGYEASSFRKETRRGDNFWNASAALDSQLDTCWMVDPEDDNIGQWIQLDLPSGEVDKIAVVVGWDQDDNKFFDYARIKKARINVFTLLDGTPKEVLAQEVDFEDKRGFQIVDIPDARVGGEIYGGQIRLTVLETYEGKDFSNLAVSEVRIHLKEFPADTMELKTPPDSEVPDHDGGMMIDLNEKTFWAASSNTAVFGLAAPGFGMASIGILPGPTTHARPKTIELTSNGIKAKHVLEDKQEWQWILTPVIVGYTGSAWGVVKVKIVDAYGDGGVAISEVKLNAATIEDL